MSRETFETLLAPHMHLVTMLVQRRLGRSGHADDVVQEILTRAFTRRNQLKVQARFRNWIWSITLNEIRQYLRRDRAMMSLDRYPQFDIRDTAISPLARLERIETREWLRGCMAELSERDQAAIRLRDFEERSLPEAAAALDCSLSAAKTVHFRARKRLAHIIHTRHHGRTPIPRAA